MANVDWLWKYAGCTVTERAMGCMGPNARWLLFDVPIKLYPTMLLISLIFAPFLYIVWQIVSGFVNDRKKDLYFLEILKKNMKKIGLIFIVLMIIQILVRRWMLLNRFY